MDSKNHSNGWVASFRQWMPNKDFLASHPWLKPIAHRVLNPALWRLQSEAVARGVAIGLFWAFAVPVGQVLVAAAHCVWWRANIPIAALMTMVTNPITIGFWLWLSYQLGAVLMGEPLSSTVSFSALPAQWIATYLWPIVVGMGTLAVSTSLIGYAMVKLFWQVKRLYRKWFR